MNQGEQSQDTSASSSSSNLVKAPVVVFVPSPIPPLTWTRRRKTYLQLALRLRRMGYCVVVPDVVSTVLAVDKVQSLSCSSTIQTFYPEARVDASVVDLRLVLRWVADNCEKYGGDPRRINLLGHGMSAHLAMLTLTQEAVVLSREGYLHDEQRRESERETMTRWDDSEHDSATTIPHSNGAGKKGSVRKASTSSNEETAWVDDGNEDELPPGAVMPGSVNLETSFGQSASSGGIPFPSSNSRHHASNGSVARKSHMNGNSESSGAAISNGLRRVEIYEPQIEIPPIAGVILLAGVFDVIKCFRGESDRGVEHLSVLRRSCGPSHTSCLVSQVDRSSEGV
jgi:hypothetical protein